MKQKNAIPWTSNLQKIIIKVKTKRSKKRKEKKKNIEQTSQ